MRCAVTGGSGFIGSYVVEELARQMHHPVILDHLKRESYPKDVDVFLGDVCDSTVVSEAVADTDGVVHLAAILGTAETIDEPRSVVEVNLIGSLNVFQACRRYGRSCVYISVGNYWMNNPYSITKDVAERFAWMFNKEHQTRISVVRGLNAYGPRQKSQPVRKIMPNFIISALKDAEVVVYGDGSQIMDMIYVEDVAKILVRALVVNHGQYVYVPARDSVNQVRFDAGTGLAITVQEIANKVIRYVGKGKICNVPMRPGEPSGSVVLGDPSTLGALFGGKVPVFMSLEEGIARTVEYYRHMLGV